MNQSTSVKKGKRSRFSKKTAIFVLAGAIVVVVAGFLLINRSMKIAETRKEQERIEAAALAESAAAAERAEAEAMEKAETEAKEAARLLSLQENEAAYQEQLAKNVFFNGISINGTDLSGMTFDEGHAAMQAIVDSGAPTGVISLSYGDQTYAVDLAEYVHVNTNMEEVLASAYGAGRRASYEEAESELDNLNTNGHDFMMVVNYDYSPIADRVREIANGIDRAVVDSTIVFDEESTGTPYRYTESVTGLLVDQQSLIAQLTQQAKAKDLTPVVIPVSEIAPSVTQEDLANNFVLRASAETSFKGSDSNRCYNIKKGCGIVNGTVLRPGEVFSMNDTLGVRTYSNGWKEANAYVSGGLDKQAGGGVCQLSTTLYNAIVKADLEVVYRKNHSMPVSYIKEGLDATINSVGNLIDFKFRNNTSGSILIVGIIKDKNVKFEIYGVPFETDEYDEIKLKSGKIRDIEPDGPMVETYDPTLTPGTTEVRQARRKGSVWQSTKIYYKKGKEVKREKLDLSYYDAFNGETLYGPAVDTSSGSFGSSGNQGGYVDDWDYSNVIITN